MSGATPVPRGPSVLLLGSSAGLLSVHGCPACWYVAESSEMYLTWFAVEGHADPDALHRLRASRGMCARHTRCLLAQPGAAARLTAVYRYVVAEAARDVGADAAGCPACDQETRAEDRTLSTLMDEFTAESRGQYRQHGGLCLPHLRRAARRYRSQDLRWLIGCMIRRLRAPDPGLDLLAGGPDPDAGTRAALRARLPAGTAATCQVCWAAAHAERARLEDIWQTRSRGPGIPPPVCLCSTHLRDAAPAGSLLAWQAEREAQRLATVLDSRPRLLGIAPGWMSPRARRALADPDCAVCRAAGEAAVASIAGIPAMLRNASGTPQRPLLCTRHASRLQAADAEAGRVVLGTLSEYAHGLLAELDAAFGRHRQRDGAGGAELSAWRRAAVFLDGSVLGGCPAG